MLQKLQAIFAFIELGKETDSFCEHRLMLITDFSFHLVAVPNISLWLASALAHV